jgi:hypothetical protein
MDSRRLLAGLPPERRQAVLDAARNVPSIILSVGAFKTTLVKRRNSMSYLSNNALAWLADPEDRAKLEERTLEQQIANLKQVNQQLREKLERAGLWDNP